MADWTVMYLISTEPRFQGWHARLDVHNLSLSCERNLKKNKNTLPEPIFSSASPIELACGVHVWIYFFHWWIMDSLNSLHFSPLASCSLSPFHSLPLFWLSVCVGCSIFWKSHDAVVLSYWWCMADRTPPSNHSKAIQWNSTNPLNSLHSNTPLCVFRVTPK